MSIFICVALFCIACGVVHRSTAKAIREIEGKD